jgi:DNA-3-methyladenine glycosylase I
LLGDAGIVRNRAKIGATIGNASAFLAVSAEHGSFAAYLAERLPRPSPILPAGATWADVPSTTDESNALSADLRPRFPLRRLDDRLRLHAEHRTRR